MALTDTGEAQSLNWLTGNPATAPVLPLMVRLMTTNGDDDTAGTECAGTAYEQQSATFGPADPATGQSANTTVVDYGALDSAAAQTITGWEVWDSAVVPVRWWYAPLTGGNLVVGAGEPCEFAIGALVLAQT